MSANLPKFLLPVKNFLETYTRQYKTHQQRERKVSCGAGDFVVEGVHGCFRFVLWIIGLKMTAWLNLVFIASQHRYSPLRGNYIGLGI